MDNTKTCNSLAFELGDFYTFNGSYLLYRYVGMYGNKRVFIQYRYACTDSTGTWFFRCYNTISCFYIGYTRIMQPVKIDKQGRFNLLGDIECELLHNLEEFEVII